MLEQINMNQEKPLQLNPELARKLNMVESTLKYMLSHTTAESVVLWEETYKSKFYALLEQQDIFEKLQTMKIRPFIEMILEKLKEDK